MDAKSDPAHRHPTFDPSYAKAFKDPDVVDLYDRRPPYPESIFETLLSLLEGSRTVLEIGCGTGEIARRIANQVERVDAVDVSEAMLARAAHPDRGQDRNIRWMLGRVEEVHLNPHYGLALAGDSLHWMNWEVVLPKLASVLATNAVFAIVTRDWDLGSEEEIDIFRRYSVRPGPVGDPVDMINELQRRGLFVEAGSAEAEAPWRPTVREYIECRHSQSGFPRTEMGPASVREFDQALGDLIQTLVRGGRLQSVDGCLQLTVQATVTWGRPCSPDSQRPMPEL